MRNLIETALAMVALWAGLYLLASGLNIMLAHQWPTGLLAALYVAASGLIASSWAADVAAPVAVKR